MKKSKIQFYIGLASIGAVAAILLTKKLLSVKSKKNSSKITIVPVESDETDVPDTDAPDTNASDSNEPKTDVYYTIKGKALNS
ncbi:MAG: hypothetical protein Q8900_10390 [Bacillota bacterium]|nr:hypothetical protein [Bacillota bacterium]